MIKQLIFSLTVLIAASVFFYSVRNIWLNIKLLKPAYPLDRWNQRLGLLLNVGFGQTKILRFPLIGFLHALVFWGFLAILFGSAEMLIDGLFGLEKSLSILGIAHKALMFSGDLFAFIILILILVFLSRRMLMHVKRFEGIEMTHKTHKDATFALTLILLLMVSLLGMNMGYVANHTSHASIYPVSSLFVSIFWIDSPEFSHIFEQINWWAHILLIFFFANYLPYSKHFHVFMSLPNVLLSKLEPHTQMSNMDRVTQEVKLMLDPSAEIPSSHPNQIERFGMKDVEDGTWKHYIDSLTCTQCGRCTSVCPANLTGKMLSPRKLLIDYRARMNEKMPHLKADANFNDQKSLLDDYISREEIWACTTCNACAQECPVNIDHPSIILELRRYIFMEESKAPSLLNAMSTNIENNGAPWQYPPSDRMKWADQLYINE
jgi:heterodisulfide reductase subunit C/nitrate reductase gamma subunit